MNNNMLVVMNPPYGKRGTLSTTVIKSILPLVSEIVCLCQPRSIEKNGVYQHVVKVDIVDNTFEAGLGDLAVSKIRNDYTEGKQVLYGKREICEDDIEYWIRDFNKGRENDVKDISHVSFNRQKYENLVESGKLFMFGVFDLTHAVQDPNKTKGLSVDLNFYRRKLLWAGEVTKNGNDCYAFEFGTKRAKDNFRDVFFDTPKEGFFSVSIKQYREFRKGVTYASLFIPFIDWEHLDESPLWKESKENAFLVELIREGGQKIVIAYLKARFGSLLPFESTDQEILKEIGLPEDF